MDKKYFCIFGGGGIRGAAYSGVIKAIKELDLNITGYAGSSIGAVVAGLISFNYSPDEIQDVFDNINFEFFNDFNFNFGKDFALSKGKKFYEWMKNKIETKFYPDYDENKEYPPVKFSDIKDELVIFTVDLTTSKLFEFSKTKTPDAEIAHAIRVSVAMPGLYAPVFNEDECLVDGDLLKGMPLSFLTPTIYGREEKILEFRLENNETKKKISNTFDYLNAVYDTFSGVTSDFIIKQFKNYEKFDFIKINTEDISVVDFMISKEKKQQMANLGYKLTIDYFKNGIIPKKENIQNIYKSLFCCLKKAEYLIENKNIDHAKIEIANLAFCIFDKSNILEDKTIELVKTVKNEFNSNYITKKGIFQEKAELIEYNKVLGLIKTALEEIGTKQG